MNFSSVKNIVFDLGGVIINIDFQYTYEAFAGLGNTDILTTIRRFESLQLFKRYETGEFTDSEFREVLREAFSTTASDQQIDKAWNALLLDIPAERVKLLQELRTRYRTFLLSNTNSIHIAEVNNILYNSAGTQTLNDLFEKIYYSYEIQMAKPDVKIYQYVLKDKNLIPEETLFIDDNKDNIEGAKAAGLQVLHVQAPHTILELLHNA